MSAPMINVDFDLTGGFTAGLFPQVEKILIEEDDYEFAIDAFIGRKRLGSYLSLLDFILCETLTEFRFFCKAYYLTTNGKLDAIVGTDGLSDYEQHLLLVLETAKKNRRLARLHNWQWLVEQVENAKQSALSDSTYN